MSAQVIVDFSAVAAAVKDFDRHRATVVREVMPQIAEVLVAAIDHEFDTEGRGRWEPLAQSTLEGRRASTSPKILQDTGVLAASIMASWGSDFAIGGSTNVPYAVYHVSDEPRTHLPKRDFTDVDMDVVLEEAAELLLDEILR